MIECMSCGSKKWLINFSKMKNGDIIYLCPLHVPLTVLESDGILWLKDTNQQTA